jgi:hypothetical protein
MLLLRLAGLMATLLFTSTVAASQSSAPVSPDTAPLSDTHLRALVAAIRSGEFKKIGSVLVARHGKLVYEAYFDGDAATLRDTRSATKSITDVLVGSA